MTDSRLSAHELGWLEARLAEGANEGQVRAVFSDKNLIVVSAGAGTGKTWTLARRYLWSALTGRQGSRILTLTFTDKASDEMRERIGGLALSLRERLRKDLRSGVLTEAMELSGRLDGLIVELDDAYISTIHSFSMRVIRESGLSLSIDPQSRLISAPVEESFWSVMTDSWDRMDVEWFLRRMNFSGLKEKEVKRRQGLVRELFEDSDFMGVVSYYGAQGVVEFVRDLFSVLSNKSMTSGDLFEKAISSDEVLRDLLEQVRCGTQGKATELAAPWVGTGGILDSLPTLDKKATELHKRLVSLKERWVSGLKGDDAGAFLLDLNEALNRASGNLVKNNVEPFLRCGWGSLKDFKDDLKEIKGYLEMLSSRWLVCENYEDLERCSSCEGRASCLYGNRLLYRYLLFIGWISWSCWESYKLSHSYMSFADMLLFAREALENNPEYSSKFGEVMVDEFQDTNDLQDSLVRVVLDQVRDEGNEAVLFLVGDLKQSIYRFQHAKPALFSHYMEEAENREDGEYVRLGVNFRSRKLVLDEVNGRFEFFWKGGIGAKISQGYEALFTPEEAISGFEVRPEREKGSVPEFLHLVERQMELQERDFKEGSRKQSVERVSETRKRLATNLVGTLISWVQEKRTVWGRLEDGSEGLRPVRWGDMAVLVPSRTANAALRQAFERLRVPVSFVKNVSYYAQAEIKDATALLQFLTDGGDRLALAGFLCSPLSGLSLKDALDVVSRLNLEAERDSMEILEDFYPSLAVKLDGWRKTALTQGASLVFSEILSDTSVLGGYLPVKQAGAFANLRKFIEILESYESSMDRSLYGATSFFTRAIRSSVKQEEQGGSMDEDSVKVMTVHNAKGLEFPVVVVWGGDDRARGNRKSLGASAEALVSFSWTPESGAFEDSHAALKLVGRFFDEREELEERQRLLYVAMTRAKDSLVFCGVLNRDSSSDEGEAVFAHRKGSWFDWEDGYLCHSGARLLVDMEPGVVSVEPFGWEGDRVQFRTGRSYPLDDVGGYGKNVSATPWALWEWCPYAWRMSVRQGLSLPWQSPEGSVDGAEFGNLVHWFMSRWDFSEGGIEEVFRGALDSLDSYGLSSEALINKEGALRGLIVAVCGSSMVSELRRALDEGRLRREVPFRVDVDGSLRLKGIIDAMWVDGEVLNIVDYKTGSSSSPMNDIYRKQLMFYGLAARNVSPELDLRLELWFLRSGERVSVGFDDVGILRSIRDFQRQAVAGQCEPRWRNCGGCAFKGYCIAFACRNT